MIFFYLLSFESYFLKYKFLGSQFEKLSIRTFLWWISFYFTSLDWKVQASISRNTRKAFFWENIRNFLVLESENSISWIIRNFFSGWIFLFLELGPNSSSSWIIRKYMNLYNIRARKFCSPKYTDFFRDGFFLFSKLGPKSAPGSGILYYSQSFLLTLLTVVLSVFLLCPWHDSIFSSQ